jgi:glycosyltransferase involved in cell wall biosynthesis
MAIRPSIPTPAPPSAALRVAALTQGARVPSTRFRVEQHAARLAERGITLQHLPAAAGAYPPPGLLPRLRWLPVAVADAFHRVALAQDADVCLLQRELVSTLCTAELRIRSPLVFDVDDAVFLHQRFQATDRMARHASLVLCGNAYLADHYQRFARVEIVPTAVDTQRFRPAPRAGGRPVIGWSGSSSGFPYLLAIEPALRKVLQHHPEAVLHVVADRPPPFLTLPQDQVHYQPWHPDTEVQSLQQFHVGLMPLPDDPFTRGKCSFKMLTYMAVGIPVVVSPVGMNADVLKHGRCGLAAVSEGDWVDAIGQLLDAASLGEAMGAEGRRIVEAHYSAAQVGDHLASLLRGIAGHAVAAGTPSAA